MEQRVTKRQIDRLDLDAKILKMVEGNADDDEICKALDVTVKRIQSVKLRYGYFKRVPEEKVYPTINDKYAEITKPKEIVGVPYQFKGKRYKDITGDIIDCGIDYGFNPYQE